MYALKPPRTLDREWKHVRIGVAGGIATVTLAHPPRNALSRAMLDAVDDALDVAEDDAVQVVIVTGDEAAFSVGVDPDAILGSTQELAARSHRVLDRIEGFPKPVIAAINGHCLGGGLELALTCHLRIASKRAKLGLPEISLGLFPGLGGTRRLPRIVGRARAYEMILTGRALTAEEARQAGLVNAVVAPGEVLLEAARLARRIAVKSPAAVPAVMRCCEANLRSPRATGRVIEMELFERLLPSPDVRRTLRSLCDDLGDRRDPCRT